MAGRKRKPGERTPSGQLSRAGQATEASYAPAAIKRLTDSAINLASDPRLGTEVGRLLLAGKLTARQAGAAWRWGEIAAEHARAIEAPSLKGATFERAAKGAAPDEASEAGKVLIAALKRAVSRYNRASDVLDAQGAAASRAVRLLAEGRGVALLTHEQLIAAQDGLDALAVLFATRAG